MAGLGDEHLVLDADLERLFDAEHDGLSSCRALGLHRLGVALIGVADLEFHVAGEFDLNK